MSLKQRTAGVLLHPTSLPGKYGIGDLGPMAHVWVEALARAKQSWWQVLPLGPPGAGDSPYQSFSAFAGNPALISPDLLVKDGLIQPAELQDVNFSTGPVDFVNVGKFKEWLLGLAWTRFQTGLFSELGSAFDAFRAREARWLDDYALFMAIHRAQLGSGWRDWPRELKLRDPFALDQARIEMADSIGREQFTQFLFFRQWDGLRRHAVECGIRLFGDAPIFVSPDSADVWAHPHLFLLDEERRPRVVAGVPPDYFSKTGQLWGNPLYDWDKMQRNQYAWWVDRLQTNLSQVDLIRLDHFRGFEAAWHIPAESTTAQIGEWVPGPGADFFNVIRQKLGGLPLVAEDLGLISPEVHALRDLFQLPGMYILQFAFGGDVTFRFLPHNHRHLGVVYTGTHDNDTIVGWWQALDDRARAFVRKYVPDVDSDPAWTLLRTAWGSVADLAIAPLQDILGLGTEARMNLPGTPSGNWRWRLREDLISSQIWDRLGDLTEQYNRHPGQAESL